MCGIVASSPLFPAEDTTLLLMDIDADGIFASSVAVAGKYDELAGYGEVDAVGGVVVRQSVLAIDVLDEHHTVMVGRQRDGHVLDVSAVG